MSTPKINHDEVTGLRDRLERLVTRLEARVLRALREGADSLAQQVRENLRDDGRSGRVTITPQGLHQASAPGEVPAPLTGKLSQSIAVEPGGQVDELRVTADTDYAAALEFGTQQNAPRPFLAPALEEAREDIKMRVKKAARKASPGTGV